MSTDDPLSSTGSGGLTSSTGLTSDGSRFERSLRLLDRANRFDGPGDALVTVFGAIFVFVGTALIRFGSAVLGLWTGLIDAFRLGGIAWVFAFTRDPAGFLSRGRSRRRTWRSRSRRGR